MRGNITIVCAADAAESANNKLDCVFRDFGFSCFEKKHASYWKNESFLELNFQFTANALDHEKLQAALASMCQAKTTDMHVSEEDIEIGCYNYEDAMEIDHSLMFAVCYIKR